jgi:hypothetical protein
MAQEIILNTDSPSSSIGDINANFTELYADKITATQTIALTNKTIDGDLNTVQDLPYTAIKSTARTGLDTKVVTGTIGDTDELAKWNVDGDLVPAGVTVSTAALSSSSLDTEIPTSKAVYTAIAAALDTKQIFVSPLYNDVATSNPNANALAEFAFTSLNNGNNVYFNFSVPANFNATTSAELVMIPDTTETLTFIQCSVSAIAQGELYTANNVTTGSFTNDVTINVMTKIRLDTRTNTPFIGMAANDIVGVKITSGTTLFRVVGLLIKYT